MPDTIHTSTTTPLRREPRRSLEHSVWDGCAHAVMLGVGEAYLSPFAIFLGMGGLALGVLATLPTLVGSIAQLAAVWLLDRVPRRRPLVVAAAVLQALIWAPLALLPWLTGEHAATWMLVLVVAYFLPGIAMAPVWNSWIGDLVPRRIRGAVFGRREQLRITFQLAALLVAGGTLATARRNGAELLGFTVIFVVALIARLVSAWHLSVMAEPPYERPSRAQSFTLLEFLRRAPWNNFGRFTIFVALVQSTAAVASPFFSLFMLRELQFTYLQFTMAAGSVLVAQVATIRLWGRVGDRFGNRDLLRICGFLIPLVPLPWLFATDFLAILLWQALGGVVWAGFNLSALNYLFDAVTPTKRARCVAYYNLLIHIGSFAGAVVGGALLTRLPDAWFAVDGPLATLLPEQGLFLISSMLRFAAALAFLPFLREVRPVQSFGQVFIRIAGLAAARGVRLSIFNGTDRDERHDGDE